MTSTTPDTHPNIIHIQKRPPKNNQEAILLDAIEKSIDFIIGTCEMARSETVTVRLFSDNVLERVLCITNDDRVFPLLNNPEFKDTKTSLYNQFYKESGDFFLITDINQSREQYPLKNEFAQLGYRTRILVRLDHIGVIAIHSLVDASIPENERMLQKRIHDFVKMVEEKIKSASESKLVGLYSEINILTTLAQEDEEIAFHQILEYVARLHPVFRTAIFGINQVNESYTLLAGFPKGAHGKDRGFLADHPLLKTIVETRKSLHVTDLANDSRTKWLTASGGVVDKYGITEIVGFPIAFNGDVKAVMTVDYAEKQFQFHPVIDQSFFYRLSKIISNILAIVSKIKQIRIEEDIRRIVDHFLHEIRNPITASAGFARRNCNFIEGKLNQCVEGDDLRKKDLSDCLNTLQRNTAIIIKESDRVEEILNEFETFIRLKRGMIRINREPVFIGDLGKYFESLFHGLVLSCSPELKDCELFMDKNRLHHVLLNLLINAYEHTYNMGYRAISHQPEDFFTKSVLLNISLKEEKIVFEIINEGMVPKENMDRIFEPYFTCGHHDGSGLGLAISSELVKLMNGQISYENITRNDKNHVAFRLVFSG